MENWLTKMKNCKKCLLRYLLLGVLAAIAGINLYSLNASRLAGNPLPTPFGYGAAVVLSGSMEPEFAAGDLIIVKQTGAYAQNDIVVFQDGRSLVVHRIISLDGETVTTKGDANNTADAPIHISAIKGEVIFWIPYIGNVVEFIKTPVGTLCIIAAILLLLEISRRNEKKKNDEEKQKIIDEIKRLKED